MIGGIQTGLRLLTATAGLGFVFWTGCAQPYGASPGAEASADPSLPAAPAPQVPPPLQTAAPPAPPPAGAARIDLVVATAVSDLLKNDPNLAGVSGNVRASVDKGVVTLRGTVPSDHDRMEMVDRVSKLSGVDRVEDALEISSHK